MIRQTITLMRILMDRKVTSVPVRVLKELKKKGIRRLPRNIDRNLKRGVPLLSGLSFLNSWLGSEMITRHNGQWVLNSFTPPFPGKAFDRAFENLHSGRKYNPISAFLALTADCPYSCWHCSASTRRQGNLTTDQWCSAVSELHELGVSIIGFTGGEPLSRPDLVQIVEKASAGGASTILFTSGAGLTEQKAARLREAGLWSVCVSLDHHRKETYNKLRNSDQAFENALDAIRLSVKSGFYTMIGAVATRSFVERRTYESVYRLARSLGVHEMRIVEPMPCGKLKSGAEEHLLSKQHTDTLREFHRTTNRKCKSPKVCAFNQIESPEIFGCSGGIQHFYVDSAGEVCPCDFTPLSFGNVTEEKLEDVFTRMSNALKDPRSHCMLQKHHALFSSYYERGYPLPVSTSLEICRELPDEPLPGYYRMVSGG